MYLTYLGSGEEHGPTSVTIVGIQFPLNVPVYVPDEDERFSKMRVSRRFRCESDDAHGGPGAKPTVPPASTPPASDNAPGRIPSPDHFATPAPGAGAPGKGDGARHVGTLPPKPGTAPGLPGNPKR